MLLIILSVDINKDTDVDVKELNKNSKKNIDPPKEVDTNITDLVTNNQEMKLFFTVQHKSAEISQQYIREQLNPRKKIYLKEAELSTTQRLLIDSAIRDTIAFSIWNRENEALTWIHAKLGFWLDRNYFNARLEVLKSDHDTQRWLNDLAREGFTRQFMIAHNRLEDMVSQDMVMLSKLYKRFDVGDKDAVKEIVSLQKAVTDMTKVNLVVLNNVPMIPQLKAYMQTDDQQPLVKIEPPMPTPPMPITNQESIKQGERDSKVIDVEPVTGTTTAESIPNNGELSQIKHTDELRESEPGQDKQTTDIGFQGDEQLHSASSPGEIRDSRRILPIRDKSGFDKVMWE